MAIASGIIFPSMGTHAGVPTGFTRETNLDDRYPLGSPASTNPNVTGGASTHTHATSHTHTVGSHTHAGITSGAGGSGTVTNGSASTTATIAAASHTHAFPTTGSQTATLQDSGAVVTASGSSLPSSYGVIWIKSDGSPAGIPSGREALWAGGTAPSGWTGQSGPAGRYLVGSAAAADAGTTSGSATHLHGGASHSHTISSHAHTIGNTDGPSATDTRNTGATAHASSTHTHTSTISSTANSSSGNQTSGNSGSTNVAPAYYKLGVIRNGTGGADLPGNVIGAWLGTLASIPSGWALCDGTSGTPDLRDKMIVAAAADLSDVGGTGGATSHDHTDPASHTHTTGHTHTIQTSGGPSATTNMGGTNVRGSTSGHTHTGGDSGSGGPTSGSGTEAIANASAYPPYRTVAWIMYALQTLSPSSITTGEAFGTALVATAQPTGIASEEAFGTAQLNQQIAPTAIDTEEAFGTAVLTASEGQTLTDVGGIATEEALGTPTVAGPVLDAGGIATEEAFGTPSVNQQIAPSGIDTAEAHGTPTVTGPVSGAGGIASEEAFGTPEITGSISPSGIATEEAFGTPVVTGPITGQGIATAEAFGTPSVVKVIAPSGIASAEAFGTPSMGAIVYPSGIASLEAFGTLQVNRTLPVSGIPTAEAFGTPTLVLLINPTGIPTEEAFGTLTVRLNAAPVPTPPTATADQIADALSGRYGGIDLRFRYSRRTRTNEVIDEILGVIEPGTVTLDNSRAVVRDLDVTFDLTMLPEDFDPANDIIGVEVQVYVQPTQEWVSIQVGLFLLDESETRYRGADSIILPCKGSDMVMALVRSKHTGAYTVPAGSNYVTVVENLITKHGLTSVIPVTDLTTPVSFTWGPGVSDYEICRDLLYGINYFPLWADRTGVIRSKERTDPSAESPAVVYQDTDEPMMITDDDYVKQTDKKSTNRMVVVIDDPFNPDMGFAQYENADPDIPNSTASLVYGDPVTIVSVAASSPAIVETATAHGFSTDVDVLLSDVTGAEDINGTYLITVIDATHFTIPIAVASGLSGGTAQATTVQLVVLSADSDPPTKAVRGLTQAEEIAQYELQYAASRTRRAALSTFIDPRREAHDTYELDMTAIESETLWLAYGWTLRLEEGAAMSHDIGLAEAVTLISPPKS